MLAAIPDPPHGVFVHIMPAKRPFGPSIWTKTSLSTTAVPTFSVRAAVVVPVPESPWALR
jgi:hypothetical protein